jgi:exonuclease-1
MGITGLLPLLKPVTRSVHLSEFEGARAAIDASGWMHRGLFAATMRRRPGATAEDLHLGLQRGTRQTIHFCLNLASKFIDHSVQPLMVFDGKKVALKSGIHQLRREVRRVNKEAGIRHHELGDLTAAAKAFSASLQVTRHMTLDLMDELKRRNIDFIVSPFEADAQLAYLSRNDLCDVVVSEDSDVLPFGCKRTIFKLDKNLKGGLIELDDVLNSGDDGVLPGFTHDMLVDMCILSGCDYLPNIKGIGLKRAMAIVKRTESGGCVLETIRSSTKYEVSEEYASGFKLAQLAFRHQGAFCPEAKLIKQLTPLLDSSFDQTSEELDFLGSKLSANIAQAIAGGMADPTTGEPFPAREIGDRSVFSF